MAVSNGTANGTNGHAPRSSDEALNIVIAGGGIGGLSAAIACRLAGDDVTVYEAAPQLSEVGAGIQCSPNVVRLLQRWGLSKALDKLAVKPKCLHFRRWQTGQIIGKTDYSKFQEDFGAPYIVVHRAHLLDALYDRAVELGVKVQLNKRIAEAHLAVYPPFLKFTDGTSATGDLILGADGIKSVTRAAFLGSADKGPSATGFCAYRATVPARVMLEHPDTAALIAAPEINLWVGPDRHVMSYLIAGGDTFNLVLSHPAPSKPDDETTTLQQTLQEMRAAYADWDPVLVRIISSITKTMRWPLMKYPSVPKWVNPESTFALLGDACHGMLPYMSSGAGMAIEDAAALGVLLSTEGASLTSTEKKRKFVARSLALYEKARVGRATEVQERSDLNGRIWHYPDGPAQAARDRGMAPTLTDRHYVRSTNQWSDPTTQLWLYGHDAEWHARMVREISTGSPPAGESAWTVAFHSKKADDIDEMVMCGLLGQKDV